MVGIVIAGFLYAGGNLLWRTPTPRATAPTNTVPESAKGSPEPVEVAATTDPLPVKKASRIEDEPIVQQWAEASRKQGGNGDGVGTLIYLNGHLCAKVVESLALEMQPQVYEVTCVQYRGGKARVSYLFDASNGVVAPL